MVVPTNYHLESKGITVAIADGVSISAAGREAAESSVNGFLSDYYSTPESWTVKTSVSKVLNSINRWLFSQGQSAAAAHQGHVTTFSGLIIKSTTAHISVVPLPPVAPRRAASGSPARHWCKWRRPRHPTPTRTLRKGAGRFDVYAAALGDLMHPRLTLSASARRLQLLAPRNARAARQLRSPAWLHRPGWAAWAGPPTARSSKAQPAQQGSRPRLCRAL